MLIFFFIIADNQPSQGQTCQFCFIFCGQQFQSQFSSQSLCCTDFSLSHASTVQHQPMTCIGSYTELSDPFSSSLLLMSPLTLSGPQGHLFQFLWPDRILTEILIAYITIKVQLCAPFPQLGPHFKEEVREEKNEDHIHILSSILFSCFFFLERWGFYYKFSLFCHHHTVL